MSHVKFDLIWYIHRPPQIEGLLSHGVGMTKDLVSRPNTRINPSTIEVSLRIPSHQVVPSSSVACVHVCNNVSMPTMQIRKCYLVY